MLSVSWFSTNQISQVEAYTSVVECHHVQSRCYCSILLVCYEVLFIVIMINASSMMDISLGTQPWSAWWPSSCLIGLSTPATGAIGMFASMYHQQLVILLPNSSGIGSKLQVWRPCVPQSLAWNFLWQQWNFWEHAPLHSKECIILPCFMYTKHYLIVVCKWCCIEESAQL